MIRLRFSQDFLHLCGAACPGFWRTNPALPTFWRVHTVDMTLNSWRITLVSLYKQVFICCLNKIFLGFKDFGSCLAKDIRCVDKDIRLVQENQEHLVLRKRRQEIDRTAAIKTSCLMYRSNFTTDEVLEYLRNLAKITSRTLRGTHVEEDEMN